jgi:hypothetical protein
MDYGVKKIFSDAHFICLVLLSQIDNFIITKQKQWIAIKIEPYKENTQNKKRTIKIQLGADEMYRFSIKPHAQNRRKKTQFYFKLIRVWHGVPSLNGR